MPPSPLHGQTFYMDSPLITGRAWDLFLPAQKPIRAAVFFIHGGGWRSGSRSIFHRIIEALLDHGVACASTDYRLDDVTVVEQIGDVREAYAGFLYRLRDVAPRVKPIVFGSSAGAQLALLLALARPGVCGETLPHDPVLKRLASMRPAGAAVVSAPITMEPWDEMVPAIWHDIRRIVGCSYEADPQRYRIVSPIAHVSAEAPPVLLMQAANEDVFPARQTEAFIQKMHEHGRRAHTIVYPQAEHGFFFNLTRRCQRQALDDLLRFIDDGCGAWTEHPHERRIPAV